MIGRTETSGRTAEPVGRLKLATSVGLAFSAGYVDVVGFVLLFGLFTAHVTGNLVMLGVALAGNGEGLTTKLLALPVFIGVVAGVYVLIQCRSRSGRRNEAVVLGLEVALLLLFMLLTAAVPPGESADGLETVVAGLAGVAAMAVQNAASRIVFADLAPTTMMTGNVTQVAIDLVDLAASRASPDAALGSRLMRTWPPVAAFAIGAVLGAVGLIGFGVWSLLAPVGVIFVLACAQVMAGREVSEARPQ